MSAKDLILICLFPVTGFTKHLTVFGDCLSAFAPRLNVITVHFLKFKMLPTYRAYPILPAVCRHL